MWKDFIKCLLIVLIGCLMLGFGIYLFIRAITGVYEKEIHQKGGLKGTVERVWEGEK